MTPLKPFLAVVLILLLCPWPAWGDEFRLAPFIGVKEEYNSNVLLVTEAQGPKRDLVSIVSPGIEMVDRTERFGLDLWAQVDRLEYYDNRDLDATNQAYSAKFADHATPRLNISAGAGYSIDSNPTLNTGPAAPGPQPGAYVPLPPPGPPGPPDPPGTGGSAASNAGQGNQAIADWQKSLLPVVSVPVKRYTASFSADYQLTEKTLATTSYNYVSDYYDNPSYHDMAHDVSAGLVYDFGKYLSAVMGRLNVGYGSFYLPDSRNDNATCTVGISRDFNEFWSVLVDAGLRHTWSEIFVLAVDPTTRREVRVRQDTVGWGWVADVSLNYRGERTQGALAYVRDLSLAPGLNGAAERNALTLTTQYRLTYEVSALLTTSYNMYKSDPSTYSAQVIDQRTVDVNTGIRYEVSKDTSVDVSYDYTVIRYPAASDAHAYRQFVFVGVRTQFPFLE
jgi:hypothetical protein